MVVKTTKTLKILEKPVIQVHEARLEYHFDDTSDPDRTKTFIAGVFIIANVRLDIKLRKDTTGRLLLEGQLQGAGNIDFEQAAEQLSPDVPFSLPKNVSLTSFLFKLERGEETTLLKLEGESQTNWHINAGFSEITVENLGGKLKFEKDRMSDAWTGFVCLTGKVLLVEAVVVAVEVYHDSKGETLAFGTVYEPEKIDLDVLTQRFAVGSDSSKSWNELVPGETESSVRSPKFNSASLFINFSSKTLFCYGNVVGFGTGLLMVKKTDVNENSTEYGFLFGLNLGSDFRFSSLNKRLSVVDEILSVQQANVSVISIEHLTVEEMRKDFSKLQGIEHKQQEVESPFIDLDIQTTSKVQVRSGVTAFAKVSFSGGESKLLSNVTQIQRGAKLADILLFAHIAEKGDDSVFTAQIKEMKLFGGNLRFDEITLNYQPSKGKTLSLIGNMSLTLTDDSHPIIFRGSLEISESKADFSMTVGGSPGKIHEPFGMFGISFEDPRLQLSWILNEDEHHSIIPFCGISGTVNFFKSASSSEKQPVTNLRGMILFQEGKPVVASISLDMNHPLSIDDMFVTLFKEQWPSGYLDISLEQGEVYYAKAKVEVDGKTYKEGFHGETEIQIFGNAFVVEVSVDRRGMAVKGYTKFEIDLVVATLTGKHFQQDKGPDIEISRYDDRTKFELSTGVKLLQEKIGTCSVGYDVQQKCFLGKITYDGELLGVSNPSIEFEWGQSGFKVRKWPVNLDLQDLIDFAKAFEELSRIIESPCEKLVGLVFDKVINTKCRLNVKQVSAKDSGNPDAWLALRLQGKLDIMIVTDEPSVTVDFPEIVATITKPAKQFRLSDLPEFLISEIGKNTLQLAKQVFTQPKQLAKFITALGAIKISKKILESFICRGVPSAALAAAVITAGVGPSGDRDLEPKRKESEQPEPGQPKRQESEQPESEQPKRQESEQPEPGQSKRQESEQPEPGQSKRQESEQPESEQPKRQESEQPEPGQPKQQDSKQPEQGQSKRQESKQPESGQPERHESMQPEPGQPKRQESKQPEPGQPKRQESKQPKRQESEQPEPRQPKQQDSKQPESGQSKRQESKQPESGQPERHESMQPEPGQPKRQESEQPEPGQPKRQESEQPESEQSKRQESEQPESEQPKRQESEQPEPGQPKQQDSKQPEPGQSKRQESKQPESGQPERHESMQPEPGQPKRQESEQPEPGQPKRQESEQPESEQPKRQESEQPEPGQPKQQDSKQPEPGQSKRQESKQPESGQPERHESIQPEPGQPKRQESKQPEPGQPKRQESKQPETEQPKRQESEQPDPRQPKQQDSKQPEPGQSKRQESKQPESGQPERHESMQPEPGQPKRQESKQPETEQEEPAQYLPSKVKHSRKVVVLDPPDPVKQYFNDNIFTVIIIIIIIIVIIIYLPCTK